MKESHTRKLQAIGNSFSITLPKSWIRRYNLEAGHELNVRPMIDGSLNVLPAATREENVINEMVIEFYHEVGGEIREKCLSGVERIIITSQDDIEDAELRRIRYFIKRLPTTRIISEGSKEIIIQNFGVKKLPSREMLHGLFSMTSDLFEAFRKRDGDDTDEEVRYKFDQVMEFYMLLIQYIRTYQTSGHLHPSDYQDFSHKKASDYRIISNYIRTIAYKIIGMQFFDEGAEYYEKIEHYFNDTFDAFLMNGNGDTIHKRAYGLYFDMMWKEGRELQEKLVGESKYMIRDLVEIYHAISDILSVINILD